MKKYRLDVSFENIINGVHFYLNVLWGLLETCVNMKLRTTCKSFHGTTDWKEYFFVVVFYKTVAIKAVKLNALFSNEKSLVPDYKKKLFCQNLIREEGTYYWNNISCTSSVHYIKKVKIKFMTMSIFLLRRFDK